MKTVYYRLLTLTETLVRMHQTQFNFIFNANTLQVGKGGIVAEEVWIM